MAEDKKAIHSIVLDAGPLITNTPSISTLLRKAEEIFTTPAVVGEIKDATARARLETLVIPFITLRTPTANSTRFVVDFTRKSGDLPVLSKTDIEVIALAYELECERNGGDWRLRKVPGQKTVNGPPPVRETSIQTEISHEQLFNGEKPSQIESQDAIDGSIDGAVSGDQENTSTKTTGRTSDSDDLVNLTSEVKDLTISNETLPGPRQEDTKEFPSEAIQQEGASTPAPQIRQEILTDREDHEPEEGNTSTSTAEIASSTIAEAAPPTTSSASPILEPSSDSDEDSDGGGWITPSNIVKHKISTQSGAATTSAQAKTLQVATVTTDYALQNTLLLMNLNLLSSSLTRIAHVKSHILRCHACFATTKQMEKQFCPRCGQPTLTRVTTSTNADGTTAMHLKKNMQWNTRGNRYSIPKPVAGTANGKMREKGGGQGGWGKDLILAEDQKEYVRALQMQEREKRRDERDLLDQDYLPGMMGGNRSHASGNRIQIGAGRNVNSKKRRK